MRSLHLTGTTAHNCALVNGQYSAVSAREIITHLIDTKIKFLNLKSFSEQVRFGRTDDEVLEAIARLQADREIMQELIEEAKINNLSVAIEANITISLY